MEIVSPLHFAYDFLRKFFSCYILLTDPISLSDCLYFLRYWTNCVLQLFVSQFVTSKIFEINLIFLIKPFSYMTEKSRQKFKYLENKKSFKEEIKSIFIVFKRFSVAKNCLRPESAPLKYDHQASRYI